MPRLRFLWKMIFDGRGGPAAPTAVPDPSSWRDDAITGSCLGHVTVLMNFLGATVITDPVFPSASVRASALLSWDPNATFARPCYPKTSLRRARSC